MASAQIKVPMEKISLNPVDPKQVSERVKQNLQISRESNTFNGLNLKKIGDIILLNQLNLMLIW